MKAPCLIFAIDHRPIMAAACAERGQDVSRVSDFKMLAVDALEGARAARPGLAAHMSILLDDSYGARAIAYANGKGIPVGQPAEKGGAIPLEFARPDWREAIIAARPAFVKVRFDGSPDDPSAQRDPQEARLVAISRACEECGVPLMPEPLLSHKSGAADVDRPERVARWIGELRAKGVRARWWKLEGFDDERGARTVADALPAEEGFLVLGKSAPLERIEAWFRAARGSERFQGFAVGRTIFWDPFLAFLEGASPEATVAALRDKFLSVADRFVGLR